MATTPGEVVLITGASTGIGLALTRLLLNRGYRVVATARTESLTRFSEAGLVASETLLILPLDVTQETERQAAIQQVLDHWGQLDVLVNNAGICYRSTWEDMDPQSMQHQLAVNLLGPLALIQILLPIWRAQRKGRIINVSSVGGMMAMPTMGAYNASKFALEGASEALWYELRPWGIAVSLIEPGFVHSDSFRNALFTQASQASYANASRPYHRAYVEMLGFIEKMMNWSRATPERIASTILHTIRAKNPRLRVPATLDARFFGLLRRWLPSRLYHGLLYRRLPHIDTWINDETASK
ncbi:MAG: SDR family oxidoreductase [Acidobacteria bacterium]|nr:SDR family oxidoreductase [Acidobacteriota bacterium]MCB9399571.1 SDR family oxidoreductase [Acidobacteriota bacterium]